MIRFRRGAGGFRSHLLIMLFGTGIAQVIPVLAMPVLSRLYAPSEFGLLTLFISVMSVLSVIGMARYELSIVLPEADSNAVNIMLASMTIALIFSSFVWVIMFFWGRELYSFLGIQRKVDWGVILPFSVFITCIGQSLYYWFSRIKLFRVSATGRIIQSSGSAMGQILSVAILPSSGLIAGRVVGVVLGVLYLLKQFWSRSAVNLKAVRPKRAKQMLLEYSNFPKYSLWGAFFDTMALQVPVVLASKFLDVHTAGVFGLSFRVVALPLTLVGVALAQVLLPKIVEINRSSQKNLRAFVLKLFFILSISIAPYVVLVSLFGSEVTAFLFGEGWEDAGEIVVYLAFIVAVKFAVSPLSCVLLLDRNVKLGVVWQIVYFCSITATLSCAGVYMQDSFFLIFCLHEIALYSLYFYFIVLGTREVDDSEFALRG